MLRAPLLSTKASWAACQNSAIQWNQNREMSGRKMKKQSWRSKKLTKASNLFSAVTNGSLVSSATAAAILTSNLDGCKTTKKKKACQQYICFFMQLWIFTSDPKSRYELNNVSSQTSVPHGLSKPQISIHGNFTIISKLILVPSAPQPPRLQVKFHH